MIQKQRVFDDHLFSDTDPKDIFDLVDLITSDIDINDILLEHELIDDLK